MNNNEDSLSSASETPLTPKSRHDKRRLFILIGIALALLALTLTYVYWYQNPNKVVSDAFLHAISAKTVSYTGVMEATGATKIIAAMDGNVSPEAAVLNARFAFVAQNKQYTLTGNGLMDENGDVYVKVKDIDDLIANYRSAIPATSLPLFDDIIDKIDNKWIKISAQDIKNYNADFAVIQKCSGDAIMKIQNDAATKSTLLELYKKYPFITVDKSLGAKGDSLGYSLKINHDVSRSFTTEYKKTAFYKDLVKCDKSYAIDKDVAKQAVAPSGTAVDVWVSRWSHILTKVDVRDENKASQTNVSIDPKFNQPVNVVVPKDATTLEKLQNDVQELLRSAQTS